VAFTEYVEESPVEEAFWTLVEKTDDCWIWRGATNGRYGRIGHRTYAHRYSWQMANGQPVPKGMFVLHSCDTPLCVRPDHLRLGTARENSRDAMRRNRVAKGVRHGTHLHPESVARGARHGTKTHPEAVSKGEHRPAAKLTETEVREIRLLAARVSKADIARAYGVTPTVVRRIVRRQSWKHVE
jgi:hypothetical protein